LLADLFQSVFTLAADSEPQTDHFLLLGGERLQNSSGLIANIGLDDGIDRRSHPAILDQVAQSGFSITADGSFERNRIAGNGLELLHLFHGDVHAAADLFVGGSAAKLLFELS